MTTAAAMLGLLLAGAAVSTWQAVRATRAETNANVALAAETSAKAQTREALDTLTDDVLEGLFGRQMELDDEEKAFLRKVLGFYESFTGQLGDSAEARYLGAKGYFKVARLHAKLAEPKRADGLLALFHDLHVFCRDRRSIRNPGAEACRSRPVPGCESGAAG